MKLNEFDQSCAQQLVLATNQDGSTEIARLRKPTASANGSVPIQTKRCAVSVARTVQARPIELALDDIRLSCIDTQGQVVHIILNRPEAGPLSGATWPELVHLGLQKIGVEGAPYFTMGADQPQSDHIHLLLQRRRHDVQ